MAGGNAGFIHGAKRSAVPGLWLFPGFIQPKTSGSTNPLVAVQLVKPASPVQRSKSLTAPSKLQPGRMGRALLCGPRYGTIPSQVLAGGVASALHLALGSEPKFTPFKEKCLPAPLGTPAQHGGTDAVFWVGGPSVLPGQWMDWVSLSPHSWGTAPWAAEVAQGFVSFPRGHGDTTTCHQGNTESSWRGFWIAPFFLKVQEIIRASSFF